MNEIIDKKTGELKQAPRKLVMKLAKILGEIEKVEKTGKNPQQHYSYTEISYLATLLRPKLAANNIFIFVDEIVFQEQEIKSKSGTEGTRVLKTYEFTFVDGDSGETFTVRNTGEGIDYGDKAHNKAATACLKYFLMNNFILAGEDSEADGQVDKNPPVTRRAKNGKGDYQECPACGKKAIIKGKAEFGGGYVCWKKEGGCGKKFDNAIFESTQSESDPLPEKKDDTSRQKYLDELEGYYNDGLIQEQSYGAFKEAIRAGSAPQTAIESVRAIVKRTRKEESETA